MRKRGQLIAKNIEIFIWWHDRAGKRETAGGKKKTLRLGWMIALQDGFTEFRKVAGSRRSSF
jgi:hypothetical protein